MAEQKLTITESGNAKLYKNLDNCLTKLNIVLAILLLYIFPNDFKSVNIQLHRSIIHIGKTWKHPACIPIIA